MTCCSLDNYSVWHGSSQLYVTSLFAQSSNRRFVFPAKLLCLQGNTGQHHLLADVFIWKITVNFEYTDTSDALYLEIVNNRGFCMPRLRGLWNPNLLCYNCSVYHFRTGKLTKAQIIGPSHIIYQTTPEAWAWSLSIQRDVGAKCSVNQAGV